MKKIYPLMYLAAALAITMPAAAQQPSISSDAPSVPGFLFPQPIDLRAVPGSSIPEGGSPRVDPTLPARLQAALDRTLAAVDPRARHGAQVSVIAPGIEQWTGVSGLSDTLVPIDAGMRFQIGSVTKTFTAAVILQLAQEGRLSLDDSLDRWLPSYPNIDSAITIRQLLNHSSGIYDYLNDDTTLALLVDAYFVDPAKTWTPEEILEHVKKPHFKRGASGRYSNTNYLLLGMIIEKVTGRGPAEEIRSRFLNQLGMTNTYSAWDESIEGTSAHGWSTGFDITDPERQVDISSIPSTGALSLAGTAGGMVSTATDLARWSDALYNGKLLDSATMKAMLSIKTTPAGDVGLGVFRYRYHTKVLYGHTGGILGYSSWIFTIPKDTVSIAILLNSFNPTVDDGMNNIAIALLEEIYRPVSSVAGEQGKASASLSQNAPNPFSSETMISYSIPSRSHVTLEIFDAMGSRVAAPVDATLDAGSHSAVVSLDGLAGGTYFYVLDAGGVRMVKTMQLAR